MKKINNIAFFVFLFSAGVSCIHQTENKTELKKKCIQDSGNVFLVELAGFSDVDKKLLEVVFNNVTYCLNSDSGNVTRFIHCSSELGHSFILDQNLPYDYVMSLNNETNVDSRLSFSVRIRINENGELCNFANPGKFSIPSDYERIEMGISTVNDVELTERIIEIVVGLTYK